MLPDNTTPVQQGQKSAGPTREAPVQTGSPESTEPAPETSAEPAAKATLADYLSSPTDVILGVNVIIFLLMVVSARGFPDGITGIRFGSNFTPLTLSGDWWRLITQNFIHFGVLHIVMNSLALVPMAQTSEHWIGKFGLIGAYVSTGVCAGIASLLWHSDGINTAGASGAIFGLAGLNLGLVATGAIQSENRSALLKDFGKFIFLGLLYGLSPGIDNAAHLGGLASGLLFSLWYVLALEKWVGMETKKAVCGILMLLTAFGAAVFFLSANTMSQTEREAVLKELQKIQSGVQQK
ncbi:MAG: rhomboid family intramembrane serine protease [Verrucomicrobia bacterium]|nr:rhomboid family intramembrane serine protease [Verrucomicrobiota bacterium]